MIQLLTLNSAALVRLRADADWLAEKNPLVAARCDQEAALLEATLQVSCREGML